jgi:hypothetical protein
MIDLQEGDIRQRVEQLFTFPLIDDSRLLESGHIGKPIRLVTPLGAAHSWFIPVLVLEQLSGFFQLTPHGEFIRFSSFCTKPGIFDTCPPANTWLNENKILLTAKNLAHNNETLDKPFLSYDGSPERIVWIVKTQDPKGNCREIMVAGAAVYVSKGQTDLE